MGNKVVRIGDKPVGPGHPCYVIAEIGINHNGSLDVARQLIDVAVDAGDLLEMRMNYDLDSLRVEDSELTAVALALTVRDLDAAAVEAYSAAAAAAMQDEIRHARACFELARRLRTAEAEHGLRFAAVVGHGNVLGVLCGGLVARAILGRPGEELELFAPHHFERFLVPAGLTGVASPGRVDSFS